MPTYHSSSSLILVKKKNREKLKETNKTKHKKVPRGSDNLLFEICKKPGKSITKQAGV